MQPGRSERRLQLDGRLSRGRQALIRDMWPEDECGGGRINGDAFETCVNRAEVLACDQTVADWFLAANDCSVGNVCIDED